MQTADMDTPNSLAIFLKEDTPHSWETWRELHHPQSPSAAKHNPLSHNMSVIHSTKEWPLTASSPLARREIAFICHNSVLPPYSRVWYIPVLSEWGNDLFSSPPAVTYQRLVDFWQGPCLRHRVNTGGGSVCMWVWVGGSYKVIFWKT